MAKFEFQTEIIACSKGGPQPGILSGFDEAGPAGPAVALGVNATQEMLPSVCLSAQLSADAAEKLGHRLINLAAELRHHLAGGAVLDMGCPSIEPHP